MIKPLLRTIPTLSGNVKLACTLLDYNKINKDTFETNIRGAHIYPLSSQLFQKSVQANLLNSSWEYDLKRFYSAYSDVFFEPYFDINKSEMPLLDKTSIQTPRNVDFEYGVKRISYSKSGCQYAFFAPIYIDNVNDIPSHFNIHIKITNSAGTRSIFKTIKINIANNKTDDHNYIYKYLANYLSKIDNNVIYMDNVNQKIVYYGIDLHNGGFTKFEDSSVSTVFNTKLPIQLFDYTISEGFKRNGVCMRQCLPLSFYFNVDKILTPAEKSRFAFGTLEFSGEYVSTDGNVISIYDFSTDYDNFIQDIFTLNTTNGSMEKTSGNLSNIMDVPFPSFSDRWITNYQFANKLSKTFNRWKLKYSSDELPYITNMSWAFSKNQNNNYKYSIFPSNYTNQSAFAEINNENKYNLVLPLGSNIDFYNRLNPLSASKYKAIMNNYCVSWFETVKSENFADFKDSVNWVNVDNGYTYYNGILYNLNYIYDRIPTTEKKIDKFAFLVYPDISNIKNEEYFKNDIKYVSNILTYKTNEVRNISLYNDAFNKTSEGFYDYYKDNIHEETTQYNLTFNGMLKEYKYSDANNIELDGTYIKTNDIVYNVNTISGAVIKTKNYYDINTIYSADLVDDDIKALYDYATWEENNIETVIKNLLGINNIDDNAKFALEHIALQYSYKSDKNYDYDPIPELFNNETVGIELTEILPAYKANMYFSSISNNTATNAFKDFYINDTHNSFTPRKWDNTINTNDNVLFKTYGAQLCKKTRFFDIAWLQYISTRVSDSCFETYKNANKSAIIESFKALYKNICDEIIKRLNSIDTNGNDYIGHLYYPELNYNEKTIANNVAIIKQNHFDTSIEDMVYANEMDDNVLYIHPFNIENIVKSLNILYDKLILDDIIYEQDGVSYIKNKYNIANLIIEPFTNINSITSDIIFMNWFEYFANNNDSERKNLYNLDADVKYTIANNKIWCYKPNGNLDNTQYSDPEYLNKVINRINELIDEKNNEIIREKIKFKNMRAILNSIDMVNMFMRASNTVFMECSAFETDVNSRGIIDQKFYKQIKCFDSNGNIKFKLEEIKLGDTDKIIKFNKEKGLFYTVTSDEEGNETIHEEFNIILETDFIKLNKKLFEFSSINKANNSDYRDIYLFRPLTDIEYDDKYVNTTILFDDSTTLDNTILCNTAVLYPCFNSIFEEDKNETLYFKNFVLNNISNVYHTPIIEYDINLTAKAEYKDTFYRYNVDNTALVVELSKIGLPDNRIINVTGIPDSNVNFDKTPLYTEEFKNQNTSFITKNNDVFKPFNLIVNDVDDERYGYYLIKVNLDNSRNIFNIRGILDSNSLNNSSFIDYIPNIKYITYINGIDISTNTSYVMDIFKQLCPFLYINLLELAADTNTIIMPNIFNLHEVYCSVINNNIGAKEHALVFTNSSNKDTSITQLQRYTNAIVPYLYKVDDKINIYNYKYKNVQKMLLETGKYASIGDIVFNNSFSFIDRPLPLNIYTSNNDINIKDYNKIVDKYLPIEYKYFNNSKMVNLEQQIKIEVGGKLSYSELLEKQTDEKTFKAFKDYLSKYGLNTKYSDDEILFLYKKYDKLYDTNPVGILSGGTKDKAYKLTYIFNLL